MVENSDNKGDLALLGLAGVGLAYFCYVGVDPKVNLYFDVIDSGSGYNFVYVDVDASSVANKNWAKEQGARILIVANPDGIKLYDGLIWGDELDNGDKEYQVPYEDLLLSNKELQQSNHEGEITLEYRIITGIDLLNAETSIEDNVYSQRVERDELHRFAQK
jgi:hypothetical protein